MNEFEFVDTHCHIQSAMGREGEKSTRELWAKEPRNPYDLFRDGVKAGVTKVICVGCDLEDSRLAIEVAGHEPNIFASIGIHPHEAARYSADTDAVQNFRALATSPQVVAVGECGLDYFYTHSPKADQIAILRVQIELALEHDLPMIFHVREALDDFWPIFDSYTGIRGVLHSFTDTQVNLDKAIQRGLHIGVNGIATFTKSPEQIEMYKNIPLSRLLLETDSPFLTPSPWRGKICEPYHTRVTAEFLAHLRNQSLDELAAATTRNAQTLFTI